MATDVTKLILKLEAEPDAVKAVAIMEEVLAEPVRLNNRGRALSAAATIAMNCPRTKARLHGDAEWQERAVGAVFAHKQDTHLQFALAHALYYFGVFMNVSRNLWPDDPIFQTQIEQRHEEYKVTV